MAPFFSTFNRKNNSPAACTFFLAKREFCSFIPLQGNEIAVFSAHCHAHVLTTVPVIGQFGSLAFLTSIVRIMKEPRR